VPDCAWEARAGLDPELLNVHSGAIALNHPLAATGLRLTITIARQLKEIGARHGIASACVGGGQGIALLVENPTAGYETQREEIAAWKNDEHPRVQSFAVWLTESLDQMIVSERQRADAGVALRKHRYGVSKDQP
jgi:hypothetical protein